ncbi:MAG: type II secretion system protein [Phycisphaerales bacterium]|nr:type II secretion system protein [Planctomycetota bacterium]
MMRRRAFTLIELLVVIAILATLIAILLPSLAAARESGRNTKCMSNLRSIGTSLTLYAADHKETFPYWSGWHIWGRAGTPQDGTSGDDVGPGWTEQLIPYSSTKDVYSDPSRPKAEAPFCYFLQARYTSAIYNRAMYTSLHESQVQFTSQFVFVGDSNQMNLYAKPYGNSANEPDCDPDDANQPVVFFDGQRLAHGIRRPDAQTGKTNLLFMDVHADTFAKYEPARMTWRGREFTNWQDARKD